MGRFYSLCVLQMTYLTQNNDNMLSKKHFTEIIGNNLKKLRTEKRLTQDELASKCGFYRTYINLVETAKRTPSSYSLFRIASGLKVKVDDIYPSTV